MVFFDVSTLAFEDSISFRDRRKNRSTSLGRVFTRGKDIVVSGRGKDAALHVLRRERDGGDFITANVFEVFAQLQDIVPSWEAPHHLFAAMSTRDEPLGSENRKGYLLRFDLEARRIVPGLILVGQGAIRNIRSDDRGRIWASLPEVGAVARVAPPTPP